jgi:zinc transport system permease protein
VVTAVSIKTVGILLVTALLIVPAAAGKQVAGNVRQLFLVTAAVSVASVVLGLWGSYYLNTASGPTIILVSLIFFVASLLW